MKTFRLQARLLKVVWLLISAMLVVALPTFKATSAQQGAGIAYFLETGRTVQGKFLKYWQDHGGLTQQGFPISEELNELREWSDKDNKRHKQFFIVQYFERAVFELHPENQPPNDVLLTQLAKARYDEKYPKDKFPNGANNQSIADNSISFNETGKHLGGTFLKYWQDNGEVAQQGFPISEEFLEKSDEKDGKQYKVQYFQRGVFQWHPLEKPPGDVQLLRLGSYKYNKSYPASPGEPVTGFAPKPGWVQAKVLNVIDGNTIEVSMSNQAVTQTLTVKYIGVTPGFGVSNLIPACSDEPRQKNEQFVGTRTKSGEFVGRTVYLQQAANWSDDKGQLWRYVFTTNSFVNAELVRQGYAGVDDKQPDNDKVTIYQTLLKGLYNEEAAKKARQDIIRRCTPPTPTPPPTSTPLPTKTPRPPNTPVQPPAKVP
jgi:endonuclease YncB( thermonuclease family)